MVQSDGHLFLTLGMCRNECSWWLGGWLWISSRWWFRDPGPYTCRSIHVNTSKAVFQGASEEDRLGDCAQKSFIFKIKQSKRGVYHLWSHKVSCSFVTWPQGSLGNVVLPFSRRKRKQVNRQLISGMRNTSPISADSIQGTPLLDQNCLVLPPITIDHKLECLRNMNVNN